jgi:glutamate---cysteine ligase / carboxylate-amine ligase
MQRTFGVEEELLLVRPHDGRPTPAAVQIVSAAQAALVADDSSFGAQSVEHEFKQEQAEIGSQPCLATTELAAQLRALRAAAATAAAASQAQIVAIATSPLKTGPTATEDDRYARMADRFGLLARQQLTCGQHVHVSIESRAEGVAVLDRIGPWLPILLALSTNSPLWQGRDTDYSSFRTIMWGLWPTSGPTGLFHDEAGYDAAIADLIATGAAMDDGMIYFDARMSARYPTVEIRVPDVCTNVDDAALLAAICRALVDTAASHWRAGLPAPGVVPQLQRAAVWRAARFGLTGELVNPLRPVSIPAAVAVAELLEAISPALKSNGDASLVADGVHRLLSSGTGAERQRAVHRETSGDLAAVVADAARRTLD